ncbi:MAG: 5-formyltetrahydrofolate cyclo-ligase [Halanaerobiales bacterium]|nr:5-formyltetrahydrofolate cyclo-ligase [Halanaerobiales bacterium]
MKSKNNLRKEYLRKRENLSLEFIKEKSKIITEKLKKYIEKNKYKNIMIFVSFRNEVQTHNLIKELLSEEDKNIYVPYIDKSVNDMRISKIEDFEKDLQAGMFNILEPKIKLRKDELYKNLDMIVVPGLIFSKQGYRIGYGGGYYDKFLSKITEDVKIIGITFSPFIVDKLPIDKYDLPVDLIINENNEIEAMR